jgi:hypothetical protein
MLKAATVVDKKRGSPWRRLGEQLNQQVPCQRKSECEVREQRKGNGQGWQRWRFFDSVSSCWKGWRKGVSTTSASSSRCSPFQSLSSKEWIPAESYQTSVDYGSELVEEKSISRPCTRKRRQRWLKWKWQQQERSKVVASSFPLAKAFERIMGCVTVKDASMLALLSVHRLSCFVYNHELREVVPPPDDTPWPILWLMAAFHPKHTFCGKKKLPDLDLVRKYMVAFENKFKWRWHFVHAQINVHHCWSNLRAILHPVFHSLWIQL